MCKSPKFCSGVGKSTKIGSSCCKVAMLVPGETYCPTSILRRPTRPENGATRDFCAISARDLSTAAAALSRVAWAWSTVDFDVEARLGEFELALQSEVVVLQRRDIRS